MSPLSLTIMKADSQYLFTPLHGGWRMAVCLKERGWVCGLKQSSLAGNAGPRGDRARALL
jgi:hypothetical protein